MNCFLTQILLFLLFIQSARLLVATGISGEQQQTVEISLSGETSNYPHSSPLPQALSKYKHVNSSRLISSFVSYCKVPTQADPFSQSTPSTSTQLKLSKILSEELIDILGRDNVELTKEGYVYGHLAGWGNGKELDSAPTIALLAHVDTTSEYTDENCSPQIHRNYQYPLAINSSKGEVILHALEERYHGHTIITSDGDTILGSDDKAGVAIIMEVARQLSQLKQAADANVRFPNVVFAFTVDEEIGRGADHFNTSVADFGYTIDGGAIGEYSVETFSADSMTITIEGRATHTAYAKGEMVNALRVASQFVSKVDDAITPEHTEGREGFVHLMHMEGSVEKCTLHFLIRSFEDSKLSQLEEKLEALLQKTIEENPIHTEHAPRYKIEISETYRNMRKVLDQYPQVEKHLLNAMQENDIVPEAKSVRGGTDGSRLSYMGLPTANLFAGMRNIHSLNEYVSVEDMSASIEVIISMLQLWTDEEGLQNKSQE